MNDDLEREARGKDNMPTAASKPFLEGYLLLLFSPFFVY